MTSELIERVARALWISDGYNPGHWDGTTGRQWAAYMLNHKPRYYDLARAAIAAIQSDAAPVAWMVKHPTHGTEVTQQKCTEADLKYGWTETPLYAHPPVDNRVSTSSPVDDRAAPNTSGKLREALAVWADALSAQHDAQQNPKGRPNQAAAAVIEADREAVRAEVVREIVAWLRDEDGHGYDDMRADLIEAKFGGRGAG